MAANTFRIPSSNGVKSRPNKNCIFVVSGCLRVISPSGKAGKCPFSLEVAHNDLHITADEFAAVADQLSKTLDYFKVPEPEKKEVLSAFAAHQSDVVNHMAHCV